MINKFLKERKRLRWQRIKASIWAGLLFGGIIGIIFGSLAGAFHSLVEGLIVGFAFGGTLGIFIAVFAYYEDEFYWMPKKLYAFCRFTKGTFKYERDIIIGNQEITDVHKSTIIADDNEPQQGEWIEGYVRVYRKDRRIYVRAGDIYTGGRLIPAEDAKIEEI